MITQTNYVKRQYLQFATFLMSTSITLQQYIFFVTEYYKKI